MCVTLECRVWRVSGLYAVLALHGVIVGRMRLERISLYDVELVVTAVELLLKFSIYERQAQAPLTMEMRGVPINCELASDAILTFLQVFDGELGKAR